MSRQLSRVLQLAALMFIVLTASGCSTVAVKQSPAADTGPKKIAIFLDGTHNDEASDTNIKRLHSLVTLQPAQHIATLYVEGVGTGSDFLGMTMGVGVKTRAKIAYKYLLENYRPRDEIYVFGFSRGAYTARMLVSLLYYAGLPQHAGMTSEEIAEKVYEEVKQYRTPEPPPAEPVKCRVRLEGKPETISVVDRRSSVNCALEGMAMRSYEPVRVEVLGLWDTVEALGFPNWYSRIKHKMGMDPHTVNVDYPNIRHGDQLCNVRRAYQALSIDDDREWVFTPLMLTRKHLLKECHPLQGSTAAQAGARFEPGSLREVWFSGAHSDVGGGYGDSLLSGVSLNWMLEQLEKDGNALLRDGVRVRQDPFGGSHNPEAGWWGILYHEMTRNVGAYVNMKEQRDEFQGRICLHESVRERRRMMRPASHENRQLQFDSGGQKCLEADTSEGKSDPLRQKESKSCAAGAPTVQVEFWPHCQGMK